MKKQLFIACSLCGTLLVNAENIEVTSFKYAGPYALMQPYQVDSVDVNSKPWKAESLLDTPVSFSLLDGAEVKQAGQLTPSSDYALHLMGFVLENTHYGQVSLKVEGASHYQVYVDGKRVEDTLLSLDPATHQVVIKYLSVPGEQSVPKVSLDAKQDGVFTLRTEQGRLFTLADVLHGTRITGTELSADGKYLITSYTVTKEGGKTTSQTKVKELKTGKVLATREESLHWMPRSAKYYYVRQGVSGRELVTVDPVSGQEEVWVSHLPEGSFRVAPTEDYLLFTLVQKGPEEKKEIYEFIDPDDRQPGWRNRTYLARFDVKTGVCQPLTFGYKNVWATDISSDGRSILVMVSNHRMGKRPTTLFSLYKMDVQTLKVEELVKDDGFLTNALFSPDGRQVLLSGSPECLGGIGKNVKEGQTPSMIDIQLYLMDLQSKQIEPLTKTFNPNVMQAVWSAADNCVYFNAEDRDCISLFRLNPAKKHIEKVNVPEEMVLGFSVAEKAPSLSFYGESASNAHRQYVVDLKKDASKLEEDLHGELKDVLLGECKAWDFVNSRGDTICGRYYLPPHFDPNKKYPMIVNYYGGCSPTSRNFGSRYPHHAYAALGYVVYVVEPSGATGFGQEFSARHVNTFGDYVADDIIEGTRKFVEAHPFVNGKKIGCIGASYGGFMTQYLQTKTDLFAAAISHAGISDHTSYWGEGYWGYSYSEVSAANSYPWKNPELFVDHSPLFNADKVHTPLLFLHGSVDTNVPIGESIQMFTALKLLGRETAMVVVEGQDHHITDYQKRIQWQNTIFAWFAKWLQDDPTWWNTLYPPKTL
ncbi:S9 family peptidase [Bacteroides mediterraneensis]|uniref:S9 family peptidase n=1 Tax=Bacteroides mediterraneensis TaxID=1841856 RepID=A0ABS2EUJ3_9BACE|nr:prolyl oligopeptidase family serine peptidase [Bacteroides mediterraneensis]MBM6758248.1 S9 family peptidase [Bacteroides mediterraneensis]MBM6781625.1 S9 family peptidase [Bacteroides mediterraneensis]